MSLSLTLNTALTGLHTRQASLQVVSNNIANASTEGFTRKSADLSHKVLDGLGVGVELGAIHRDVDKALQRDIRETLSLVAADRAAQPFFAQMQDLFGSPSDNNSISATLTGLATSMEALAATPEGPTQRTEVINAALKLVRQLNLMSNQVQTLRSDVERELSASLDEVNNQLNILSDLNDEIKLRVNAGETTAEFEDKRDLALDRLSALVNIQTFERSSGEVVIFTSEGTLLDSFPNFLSHTPTIPLAADVSHANGGIGAISLNNRDITTTLRGGEIKGLIDLRDTVLPGLQAELDQLSSVLRDEINALHNQGVGLPPANTLTGSRLFDSATDVVTITGTARFAVVDRNGVLPENLATAQPFEVDFGALAAPVTVQDIVDEINAQATVALPQVIEAQLVAEGSQVKLEIFARNPAHHLVVDTGDSQVSAFTPANPPLSPAEQVRLQNGNPPGFSHFFGLNDFFASPSYPLGDDTDLAGLSRAIAVRQELVDNPSLLSRDAAAMTFPLTGGDSLVTSGGSGIIQAMAAKFDERLVFGAAGQLSTTTVSLAAYGAEIVFENATAAVRSQSNLEVNEALHTELKFRSDSLSGVNMDEELAQMIVIQQAYGASARLITTVQDLFEVLNAMVR